jgi:VWFA-related protein
MPRLPWLVCLGLVATATVPPRAQEPPRPPTIGADDWPTFRAGVRLATVDAVVVDGQGRQITDLKPSDFEIVERGTPAKVRQAVYVRAGEPTPGAAPVATQAATRARPLATIGAPAAGPSASSANPRVLAIVVDDLGLSFESTASVRRMLATYVDEHIERGDLVAIIRTSGGVGALQQFTTDRRLLHAAIDRVRWTLHSRSGVSAFAAAQPKGLLRTDNEPKTAVPRPGKLPLDRLVVKQDVDDFRVELASAGTLGALEYVVRGIEPLAGRKSLVFVSEGFDLGIRDRKSSRVWSAFTRMMDRANRSGVVVYSLDARGLQTGGPLGEDNPQTAAYTGGGRRAPGVGQGNANPADQDFIDEVTKVREERTRALMDTQDTLVYMAQQTGGFAILNTNDLARGLARIADDTRGYYLLGFETEIPASQPWNPDDVRVRVKRPGLTLRARRGLFGPGDTARPRDAAPADPLVAAALSPFATGDIDVRLTTLFAHDAKVGSYVRTLFFIDPAALTFVAGPDGRHDADLTLLLLAVGDNGRIVGQSRVQVPLRLDGDAYGLLRQRGLLYSARVAIAQPGGYQIRTAVQDDRSRAIGTGTQYVEVPKVGKDHVALSGVVMMDVAAGTATPDGATVTAMRTDRIADGVLGEPAIKIFKPGSEVAYTFEIYDGRGEGKDGLSTRATLLRDGQAFYTTPPAPIRAALRDAAPVGAVPVGGTLSLGHGLPRGTYTLQVSVAPQSGKGRDRPASQWVDFEVR